MAQFQLNSPLLLFGTTFLILGIAACVFVSNGFQETVFNIDMSDEDENEYS